MLKGHGGVMPNFADQSVHIALTACMFAEVSVNRVHFDDAI